MTNILTRAKRRWNYGEHYCEITHPRYATYKATLRVVSERLVPRARVYVSGGEELIEFRLADVQTAFELSDDEMVLLVACAMAASVAPGTVDSDDAEGLAPIAIHKRACPSDSNPGANCTCLG